jgi:hypothetical protein
MPSFLVDFGFGITHGFLGLAGLAGLAGLTGFFFFIGLGSLLVGLTVIPVYPALYAPRQRLGFRQACIYAKHRPFKGTSSGIGL